MPSLILNWGISNIKPNVKRYNESPWKVLLLVQLQKMFHNNDNYIRSFKRNTESRYFQLGISSDGRLVTEHSRRFNEPETNEAALILSGEQTGKQNIIIKCIDCSIQQVSDTHRSHDALQYPLLYFLYRTGWYHFGIPRAGENSRKTVLCMNFYASQLMFRPFSFNLLHWSMDLFQQSLVDMDAKLESDARV